jgi:hypothetical protein
LNVLSGRLWRATFLLAIGYPYIDGETSMKADKRNRRESCCDAKREVTIPGGEAESIETQEDCGSVRSSAEASVMEVERRD